MRGNCGKAYESAYEHKHHKRFPQFTLTICMYLEAYCLSIIIELFAVARRIYL